MANANMFVDLFNTGSVTNSSELAKQVGTVFTHNVSMDLPNVTGSVVGVTALADHFELLLDAFPDAILADIDLLNSIVSDQVRIKLHFSGTQVAPYFGMDLGVNNANPKIIEFDGLCLLQFNGVLIQRIVWNFNVAEIMLKNAFGT